jgi:uncharacterized protein with ATP-grasp and redox domains
MKTFLDCVPCFFRQALDAARLSKAGGKKQKEVLLAVAEYLPKIDMRLSPPEIDRQIILFVGKRTGMKKDAYREIRKKSNRAALKMYPRLKKFVNVRRGGLKNAVDVAIEGNVIDYGATSPEETEKKLKKLASGDPAAVKRVKGRFDFAGFKNALRKAKNILYLADNAGETVFDRVLTEYIKEKYPDKKIIYAVKEKPAINDALLKDAYESGLGDSADIISSGSDAPGTVLSLCSGGFIKLFNGADMVISKGQGNYEALSGVKRRVFFLFVAKCGIIARHAGCEIGDQVLINSGGKK